MKKIAKDKTTQIAEKWLDDHYGSAWDYQDRKWVIELIENILALKNLNTFAKSESAGAKIIKTANVQNLSSEEQVQPLNIHDVSNSKNIQIDDEVTVEIHKEGTVIEIDGDEYCVQFWKDGYSNWFLRHEIEG